MLKIGITGGIGSGKTTVCRIFESLGVPVFYADTVAKQIMVTDKVLIAGIKDTFGNESYDTDGKLNNKYIASIVFSAQRELDKLNALVHPATFRAFESWLGTLPISTPYILKEAALLFESGSYQLCDKSVLVTAPLALRIARVMERDQVSREQVESRINKQFSDEIKKGMADYFIENKETDVLIPQVFKLHHQFLK